MILAGILPHLFEHHEDGIETLVGFGHLLHEGLFQVGVHVGPRIDDLVVTLVVGDETHVVVHRNLVNFLITVLYDALFLGRDDDIVEVEGQTALDRKSTRLNSSHQD